MFFPFLVLTLSSSATKVLSAWRHVVLVEAAVDTTVEEAKEEEEAVAVVAVVVISIVEDVEDVVVAAVAAVVVGQPRALKSCTSQWFGLPPRLFYGLTYCCSNANSPGFPREKPSPEVQKREDEIIASQKDLSVQKLSVSKSNLPQRPGYGTLGSPTILRTNYFHLLPKSGKKLFKYAVEIDPPEQAARKKRRIFTLFLQTPQIKALGYGVATDYSSNIVTSAGLDLGNDGRRQFKIVYYDKEDVLPGQVFRPNPQRPPKNYTIKVQSTGNVDIAELLEYLDSTPATQTSGWDAKSETIQALNIIMARTPNFTENVVASSGNKFYAFPTIAPMGRDSNGKLLIENSLGGGLFALKGFYSSVRTSNLRVLLNVNVCTSAFYPAIGLLDLIHLRVGRVGRLNNADYGKLETFLKRLRVSTNHVKRDGTRVTQIKTIRGFSRKPRYGDADETRFRCNNEFFKDKDVSVKDYYLKSNSPIDYVQVVKLMLYCSVSEKS